MAEVTLNDVWKVYQGGVEAVREFSLDIADGEFVVLVGPSGCGKSTTLRMIAGLEEVSRGTIRIGDRVVNDVHPKDRDIAMVFQNYALYPHMTVYKNMAFALRLRNVPKAQIDRRVHEAARILGIDHLLDRKPRALSGGQRQRVAVGRAIVREPKAFLFDEPLSNLDAKLRVTTRGELKALHQRLRTTTVYVTHDQEEAMTLGDRVVVMADAVIQQVDSPFDVYRNPVNRFVAEFIGTPPMNFFQGRLEKQNGNMVFIEQGAGGQSLRLCARHAEMLSGRSGAEVVVGVRPQALRASEAVEQDRRDGCALEVHVEVVEPLGDEMDVRMATEAHKGLVARISSLSGVKAGEKRTFAVDPQRVHVFEPGVFGLNLTSARAPALVG
ncbi:MAG: sn-glycerol-3-phosphate ABC transporter ATP-binding protein UgpC [Leptolyngbya sp. PLA3]|nr:MAG: sn-glycerol-3-phosphate ABC transporter ATP-binding protein UgpC [Cyanobacteria bacterium CYA]MCE7967292.1 sn-glycerol-3-phosphate ABC transporter ATP-binding protein UgpC [Leptolyngbya sp. PL-A3]